mgnify:CR=1 FL=1
MKFWTALKIGIKSPVTTGRRVADALEHDREVLIWGEI